MSRLRQTDRRMVGYRRPVTIGRRHQDLLRFALARGRVPGKHGTEAHLPAFFVKAATELWLPVNATINDKEVTYFRYERGHRC